MAENMDIKRLIHIAGALICACLLIGAVPGAMALEITEAPLNPEFVKYFEEEEEEASPDMMMMAAAPQEEETNNDMLGEIPSPVTVAWPEGSSVNTVTAFRPAPSESRYDLRDEGRVGPVRDQGHCGSCWAFAALGSLESYFMPDEKPDFSENNLKNTHGFDWVYNKGGNANMATAYLSRWDGPVNESDDPYNPLSGVSPDREFEVLKHVQDVTFLPKRTDRSNVTLIKQAIMETGGLYSSMYWSNGLYNEEHSSYYNPWFVGGGHAVLIVGWDDNYSKDNFNFAPPGDGAFIVRNSWNSSWGDDGYFYQSYYDPDRGYKAAFTGEDTDDYTGVYLHDPLGWTTSIGTNSETGYFANVFEATSADRVGAVGLYSPAPDASYEVSVYLNPENGPVSDKEPVSTISGTLPLPGYHTLPLAKSLTPVPGDKFSVVVKLTTPNYYAPVAVEKPLYDYSTTAKATAGESYVSDDGGKSWEDLTNSIPDTNACIKAYTILEEPEISFSSEGTSVDAGAETEMDILMSRAPRGLAGYEMRISVADPEVATISSVSFPDWARLSDSEDIEGGIHMTAVDLGDDVRDGASDIVIGKVRVKGLIGGSSDLVIDACQFDADGGELITTQANQSAVLVAPAEGGNKQSAKASLDLPGCNLSGKKVSVKNSGRTEVSEDKKSIIISHNTFRLTIRTAGDASVEGDLINGTFEGIEVETLPLTVESDDGLAATAGVQAELSDIPEDASLVTTLVTGIPDDSRTAFQNLAKENGLVMNGEACSLDVTISNLTDGKDITSASVLMSISPEWVNSHGGAEAVRVARLAEDGSACFLDATCLGVNDGKILLLVKSPEGLCQFSMFAVTEKAAKPVAKSSSGGGTCHASVGMTESLHAGENVTLRMSETPVTDVTITAKQDIYKAMVSVEKTSLPASMDAPEADVFAYVDAKLYHTPEENLAGEAIAFQVPDSWLDAHHCTAEDIVLLRNTADGWQSLETTFIKEENGYACFTADTDALSFFAIGAEISSAVSPEVTATAPEVTETQTAAPSESPAGAEATQKSPLPFWIVLLSLGILVLMRRN